MLSPLLLYIMGMLLLACAFLSGGKNNFSLDPNTKKVKMNAIYYDKTQHVNFQGDPLCQATK